MTSKNKPLKAKSSIDYKEIVQEKQKKAAVIPIKNGFTVIKEKTKDNPIYLISGIAKTEDAAWKIAAHGMA